MSVTEAGEGSSKSVATEPVVITKAEKAARDAAAIAEAERQFNAGWGKPLAYDYGRYTTPSGPAGSNAASNVPPDDSSRDAEHKAPAVAANDVTEEANDTSKPATENENVPIWASNAKKYEWSDEFGDVGPVFHDLELQLFHGEHINRTGIAFDKLTGISVKFESIKQVQPALKFEEAGLHPVMLANIKLCRYDVPTPIQAYCIPSVLQGQDVIAIAQTGSGKTAAFLIPIISKLMGKAKQLAAPRPDLSKGFVASMPGVVAEPLVLVVAPTRELATQIFDEARRLCYRSMLRPCVVYGGAPPGDQMDELRRGCDILIGTPGRIIDFMGRTRLLTMRRVRFTVIDEADEMVSPDWESDMQTLIGGGDLTSDADHVYMMFSATFPKEARQIAKQYMSADHIRIRVGRAGSSHMNITQRVEHVEERDKRDRLWDLLLSMPPSRTIVFVNSKKSADLLDDFLFNRGLPSTSIHSDRMQREREDAIRAFKVGKTPILIATGVSARGLDIKNVMHIVNFDLPRAEHGGLNEYVHRIGRTARIGNIGLATSFWNERNEDIAADLVKILLETKQDIPEFLEGYKPEDVANIDFEDDSDGEDEENEDEHKEDEVWNAVPSILVTGANNKAAAQGPTDPSDPFADTNKEAEWNEADTPGGDAW